MVIAVLGSTGCSGLGDVRAPADGAAQHEAGDRSEPSGKPDPAEEEPTGVSAPGDEEDGPAAIDTIEDVRRLEDVLPSEEDAERTAARVQERIASCMAEEGFDYESHPFPVLRPQFVTDGLFISAEVAERDGFGLVRELQIVRRHTLGDPNEAIRKTLGDEEQGRYYEALLGSEDSVGCQVAAQSEEAQELEALDHVVTALYEEMMGAEDLEEPLEVYAACMEERGHPAATPLAARSQWAGEVDSLIGDVPNLGEVDAQELERALELERERAMADAQCRSPHSDAYERVELERVRGFVSDHAGVLLEDGR